MNTSSTLPKIKAVIIDDDAASVSVLAKALTERGDVILCGTADNLSDGEHLVGLHTPDLLFLDMEFPDSNGLEWYENANLPANTRIVFYTCYKRYIHDALSLRVFDFLLKPFDPADLDVIIMRFRSLPPNVGGRNDCQFDSRHAFDIPGRMTVNLAGATAGNHSHGRPLAITSVINSKIIVNPAEIVYFRYLSDRKIWECVFSNLKRIILKKQTTAETILAYGSDFVRTHKHFIVNMRYVGIISGNDCILLPPLDSITEIKISKSYRRDLLDRFYDI